MKVRLKPLSHPQLGDIEVDSSLFAIGRREEPFTQLEQDAAKLSRRHARLFVEDGRAYLADLQSLNGTRVNGKVLGTDAQVLGEGDMVDFGGAITFKVEIDTTEISAEKSVRLLLKPTVAPELDSIVIERFPFMINRDDAIFSQHKAELPDEVKRISRRHAVFALKGSQVCLEDLDSSNGTFVNDERLDEHARDLHSGDTIRFGGQKFAYIVHVDNVEATQDNDATILWAGNEAPADPTGTDDAVTAMSAEQGTDAQRVQDSNAGATVIPESNPPEGAPTPAPVVADGDKTRFIESPTSFLEVFCAPVGEEEEQEEAAATAPAKPAQPGKIGQFGQAIGIRRHVGTISLIFVAFAIIGLVAGVTYWLDSDKRRLEELVEAGQYNEAVAAANNYLQNNNDDVDATRNGEKALIRAIVPSWSEMLDEQDYEGAQLYVADAYQPAANIGRGTQMLDLLIWVARVQRMFHQRGGIVSVTDDELELQSLVTEWDADQYKHRQLITQMIGYDTAFEPYAASAMSRLVQMRNNDATFGQAISKLKRTVTNSLDSNRLDSIETALTEFTADYPTVEGLDDYHADLRRYRDMQASFEDNDLFTLARLSRQGEFRTTPFESYTIQWLKDKLPSDALIQTYEEAATQWRRGAADDAIATLTSISARDLDEALDSRGSETQVNAKISRYQTIDAAFAGWQQSGSVDDLLVLRELLESPEDSFYIDASAEAFAQQRHVVVEQLDQSLQRARDLWQSYQSEGGIPGLVRLQKSISNQYRTQSERLRNAYGEIQRGGRQQDMLQIDRSQEWTALEVEIINEIKRRSRPLGDPS
ncbi:MAG: FHA domain-containing protein, partial [Pseudomonadota bacterium]